MNIQYQGQTYQVSRETGECFVIKTRRKRTMCRSEGSTYLSRITSPRKIKQLTKLAIQAWVEAGRP